MNTYEERMEYASKNGKFSHLATWKELFVYQGKYATSEQVQEIAGWARRKNKGESVTLPLMNYVAMSESRNDAKSMRLRIESEVK